jgi:Smg protein
MFEVLVFMFENYFAHHAQPNSDVMAQELSAAGFDSPDIVGAFDWFQKMQSMLTETEMLYAHPHTSFRMFTEAELKKISTESLGFVLFMQQANVINGVERDLIIDRAMALPVPQISIEEMRWIAMIALWNEGREQDYLFVEDALFNPRGMTVH